MDGARPASAGTVGRRRRLSALVIVGAVGVAVGALGAGQFIRSPQQVAAEADAPEASVISVPVEYRALSETVIVRGRVEAGKVVSVAPTGVGAGGGVVTKVLVSVGDKVSAGTQVVEVSGRPVLVLPGLMPAYRDLRPGARGEDVAQLQRALRELGHGVDGDEPGVFGADTKAALAAFYRDVGYEPISAVKDSGITVTEAERSVTHAERALAAARGALDGARAATQTGTQPGDGADVGTGSVNSWVGETRPSEDAMADLEQRVAWAEEDLTVARQDLADARMAAGPMLPLGEVVFIEDFPARVGSVAAAPGDEVSGPVMTLSVGELTVLSFLSPSDRELVRTGLPAVILSELSGISAEGEVELVSETMTDPVAGGGEPGGYQSPGYRMVVKGFGELPAELTGQDVRLTITAARTEEEALLVPLAAVTSAVDGTAQVTVVSGRGQQRRVEVATGASGDGRVAVTPRKDGALSEGDHVVVGVGAVAQR